MNAIELLRCSVRHWIDDNAPGTGASLAFYSAFSLAPLLVIVMALAGAVVGAETAMQQVEVQLTMMLGPSTAALLMQAVRSSQQVDGIIATVVSIATLLVGATSVLAALKRALEEIWETPATQRRKGIRGWVHTRLLSLGFILALGFLLLTSLTVSTALSAIGSWFASRYAGLIAITGALDLLVSLLLIAALFALIYRYVPERRVAWRVVIAGGLITALLFNVGRWAVGLYLAHTTQPSAFGAAAAFAALLLWLYYTAQIFLFGAHFTACLGGLHRQDEKGSRPKPGARGKRHSQRDQ